jgi:hypothetical protein
MNIAYDRRLPDPCYAVLHISPGPTRGETLDSPLIVTETAPRFDLNEVMWIERLDVKLSKNIQQACEPPHYRIDKDGVDRHLYAFIRRVPKSEKTRYEGMTELLTVAGFSRLIHPTSIGERYCALLFDFGLPDTGIQAIQFLGTSPDIFLANNRQNWLSVEDGKTLRKFLPWLSKPMHKRVHRAYWNHEYALRSYYLDARWIHAVSGLEALINVDNKDNKAQFRERVEKLALEFKVTLSREELTKAYDLRSKLVHGAGFLFDLTPTLPQDQHSPLYVKLESVLRCTLRRCLLDESFGNRFRNDQTVVTNFPMSSKLK